MGKLKSYNVSFATIFWIYFHIVITISSAVSTVEQNQEPIPDYPTANIQYYSFDRGTLDIIEDHVNSKVSLHAVPRYFEAYLFQCNSSYPVQWSYEGEGAPIVTADVGRFFEDFYDVKTYTYQSILFMYKLYEQQSGRYICKGMQKEREELSVYFDVFVPSRRTKVLLSTTEKTLFVTQQTEYVYLPCSVSDVTADVSLYRGNTKGSFRRLNSNDSISFDPKKGFKLRLQDLDDPFGTYMCTAAGNRRRRRINVIPETYKSYFDKHPSIHGKIPVQISYDSMYNRILCCTGSKFTPHLQWAGCTSSLDCKIKSVCFEEGKCEPRLGHSGNRPSEWINPGPVPEGCAGWRLRDDPNGDMGMFKCSTPGISQFQPYLLNRKNIFFDFETLPPAERIMTLTKVTAGPVYVGHNVEFHCNGTRFFFAYGFRWAFQRGNGDLEFIKDSDVVKDRFPLISHKRQTTFKIPHADVKSIICFGPVIHDATEWKTAAIPLDVKEFFRPTPPPEIHMDTYVKEPQLTFLFQQLEASNDISTPAASVKRNDHVYHTPGGELPDYLEPMLLGFSHGHGIPAGLKNPARFRHKKSPIVSIALNK